MDRLDKDLTIGQMQGEDGFIDCVLGWLVVYNYGSDSDREIPL